jgi:hypothetical protein
MALPNRLLAAPAAHHLHVAADASTPCGAPLLLLLLLACAQTESALPCSWLDKFYSPVAGPGYNMPHETDIKTFVHEDCSPSPPCACAGVQFDGTDPGRGPVLLLAQPATGAS